MAKKWYWCGRGTTTVKSKKKCEELKKGLTAVQIQLWEIQGFTDKQKSFCSLGLTKKPTMLFCDTLIYPSRFNARLLIKDLFHKMPLKSKLKISCCPSSNIMRMNRAICMIPELARIYWKTSPFFGRTSWKPWQEIVMH